jgi:hypothetical protein
MIARVAAHFCSLRAGGVMSGGASAASALAGNMPEAVFKDLVNISRFLHAVHRLRTEVLPSAEREPGRLYARAHRLERHSPRGAVNWARTIRHRLGRESIAGTQHVCRVAERTLLAPENVLLLSTIITTLGLGRTAVARLRESGVLQAHDCRAFGMLERHCEALRCSPFYRSAWEDACALSGHRSDRLLELEAAVDERTRFQPPAAPRWALQLLRLREDICDVPNEITGRGIELDALWLTLAKLEAIACVKRAAPIRWMGPEFIAGWHDVRLEAREREGYWLLRRGDDPVACITWSSAASWREVRAQAVMAAWEARYADKAVDNWIVIHRCTEIPPEQSEARRDVTLHFSRVSVERLQYSEISNLVRGLLSSRGAV